MGDLSKKSASIISNNISIIFFVLFSYRNGTHFQNDGYPGSFDNVASCELKVNKCDSGVCQLRLDLINFVMRPPESSDHKCQDDQFIVSGR